MSIVENYLGIPLQSQKIVPGNTAMGIAASIYKYTEYEIGYDAGHAAALIVAGNVITGATSGAMGIVKSVTIVTGTIGTSDAAGKIRFKSWNGINFTDDEKIKIAADADVGTINGSVPVEVPTHYDYKGAVAKHLLLSVKAQTALLAVDGSTPDQTAPLGHNIPAAASYVIHDAQEMAQAKVIDAVAASASTVIVTAYF
jgi:hypothetical protein